MTFKVGRGKFFLLFFMLIPIPKMLVDKDDDRNAVRQGGRRKHTVVWWGGQRWHTAFMQSALSTVVLGIGIISCQACFTRWCRKIIKINHYFYTQGMLNINVLIAYLWTKFVYFFIFRCLTRNFYCDIMVKRRRDKEYILQLHQLTL